MHFCVEEILDGKGGLKDRLQNGLDKGFSFYEKDIINLTHLSYYGRLRDLRAFRELTESGIRSTVYVVDSIEAAIWLLLPIGSFKDCLLTAVNWEMVGAIAGGFATLFYGCDNIQEDCLLVIKRRDWIEDLLQNGER